MATRYRDRPWRRLFWLLPTALALSLLSLDGFVLLLQGGTYAPPPPKPIEVEVVELPSQRVEPPPPPQVEPPPPPQVKPPAPPPPATTEVPPRAPAVVETQPPVAATEPPQLKRITKPPAPAARAKPAPHPAFAAASPAPAGAPPAPSAEAPTVTREPEQPESALTAAETAAIEEHRRHVAEMLYSPGGSRNTYEAEKAMAAGLRPNAPPLTPEEWKALDEEYFVGAPDGGWIDMLVQWAPLRAAMSPRAPPLTREQWDALDRIYHVGGYVRYQEYREALARATRLQSPSTLGDLTPDERHFILASRGIVPVKHGLTVSLSQKLTLVDCPFMADYNRRGAPPVVLDIVLPELPEALRKQPAQWNVVARLQIDRDGSTKVELTGSSGNDAVDRALLEALQRWRFRSAFYGYQIPMASTDELRISLVVK